VALGFLALLGIAAAALLGGPPRAVGERPTVTPTRTPPTSPPSSPSPTTTSPSPTTPSTPDTVDEALAAFVALLDDGLADGRISDHAEDEIEKHLGESLTKFGEGDSSEAIKKLEDLESKIDDFVEHEEIEHSEEQALDRAIEDLVEALFLADPPGGDEDD
jgi:demethoxyubiquinone hydroxylase (CLK1/Coq7/Cat5 family)